MKFLSAVLVLFAGLVTLVASTFIGHDDTQLFIGSVGLIVAGIGLSVWGVLMRSSLADTQFAREPQSLSDNQSR